MSFAIEAMTDGEVLAEIGQLQRCMTDPLFDELESELHLRAAVLGWTGDPLKQPPRSVLASIRSVMSRQEVAR